MASRGHRIPNRISSFILGTPFYSCVTREDHVGVENAESYLRGVLLCLADAADDQPDGGAAHALEQGHYE